jgi:hypothetical protein
MMKMSNPLFNMMGGMNPMNMLMQRLQQFRQMFTGDPRQQIQQLMNSGKVSQDTYNQAYQQAQQIQRMLGGR